MKWSEFTAIPNGTRILNHGWDQCVAVANLYHESVRGGSFVPVASAYQWWTNYDSLPQVNSKYTRHSTPQAGDIFVARGGIYDYVNGHIGVVEGVFPDGTFSTIEQNAEIWRYLGRYRRSGYGMLGFLRPRTSGGTKPVPAKPKPTLARRRKNVLFAYYKDAAGKGQGRWAIFQPGGHWMELRTQKAANAWTKQLGPAVVTDAGGWAKYKRFAGVK